MLDKISLLLQSGINQLNEKTAKISVKCWKILIDGTAQFLNENEWDIIMKSLCKSLKNSLPFAFSSQFDNKCCEYQSYQRQQRDRQQAHHRYPMPKYNKSVTDVQCMVHLIVLDQLFNISINYSNKLTVKQMNELITSFEHSYKFAREFNCNINFRNFLLNASHSKSSSSSSSKSQFANNQEIPDLYFQETRASSIILDTLLTLCSNYIPSQPLKINMTKETKQELHRIHKDKYMPKLYSFCNQLVESYCDEASIQPFSTSTRPSLNFEQRSNTPPYVGQPTPPKASVAKIPTPQRAKVEISNKKSPGKAAKLLSSLKGKNKNKNKNNNKQQDNDYNNRDRDNDSVNNIAREYQSRRNQRHHSRKLNPTMSNTDKGFRLKTGAIVNLLDSILDDTLWENLKEQEKFILNLYDYLILCIAIDNREIRQRISKLFGGCIKSMLMLQYPLLHQEEFNQDDEGLMEEEKEEQLNEYDNTNDHNNLSLSNLNNVNNDIGIVNNDNDANIDLDDNVDRLQLDTSRIVSV